MMSDEERLVKILQLSHSQVLDGKSYSQEEAERRQYEASQKEYWDYTSTLETAERKGALKGKTEIVQRMKAKGFSVEDISEIAGLTIEEVKKLLH